MVSFRIVRDRLTTDGPTMGQLFAGGATYQTLELPWRENAHGVSCIPPGTYPVTLKFSPKFQRMMPLILDVPGRTSILIHPANSVTELEGCVAIGAARIVGKDSVPMLAFGARRASEAFNFWLRSQTGPITVEISYAAEAAA